MAEERLNIARDLHDTVAHSMATINVQAGAAAHVVDRQPEQAREALARRSSRPAARCSTSWRPCCELLRVDPGEASARAPTPGLGELGELVALGAAVPASMSRFVVDDGRSATVLEPIGVAAYRIVQESLTNVVRHAGSASDAP